MRKTAQKVKAFVQTHPHHLILDEAYQLASLKHAPEMAEVIYEVKKAFAKGITPEKSLQGTSATFFLKDCEGHPIAVFKRYHSLHEYAAFRLDHERFADVPPTVITTLDHPILEGKQTGSCQYFVPDSIAVIEMDKQKIQHLCPASVRRIASLDIRILNEDRHTSNILIKKEEWKAVPIDHGYILPGNLSQMHLSWLEWHQAATAFSTSELSYIFSIDPDKDRMMLLEELHFEESAANRLYVATILLKNAARRGLTPLDIGNLLARNRQERSVCSHFEQLIAHIKERNPPNWRRFTLCAHDEIEKLLDKYEKINQQKDQSSNRRV